ncbi:MAG: DUF6134 family protein [Methylophilaceae bacterium]
MPLRYYFILFGLIFSINIQAKEWAFDVYLDESKMGTHTYILDNTNMMTSTAKFKVKILFINAYNYNHVSKEQWQDGCLSAIEAQTTENKVKTKVSGKLEGEQFNINTNGVKPQKLPACVMTFAYWNPKILMQSKLLNPQNAEYLSAKIKQVGTENIDVKGVKTETEHYLLQGLSEGKIKLNIDLWYDQNKNWVALQSTTPEGYKVIYKLK